MGKNKRVRKQIQGEDRVIREHEEKIAAERRKPHPDQKLIQKWRKDIERHRRIRATLEVKLTGRSKP